MIIDLFYSISHMLNPRMLKDRSRTLAATHIQRTVITASETETDRTTDPPNDPEWSVPALERDGDRPTEGETSRQEDIKK